jgi:hypothetical protein
MNAGTYQNLEVVFQSGTGQDAAVFFVLWTELWNVAQPTGTQEAFFDLQSKVSAPVFQRVHSQDAYYLVVWRWGREKME